nr:hypothetical protein [Syntrophales bacterium]
PEKYSNIAILTRKPGLIEERNRGLLFSLFIKDRSINKLTDGEAIVACVYEIDRIAAVTDPYFFLRARQ